MIIPSCSATFIIFDDYVIESEIRVINPNPSSFTRNLTTRDGKIP